MVTTEASQYQAIPYVSPCASSQAARGAVAGLKGGRVAAAASGTSAASAVTATTRKARRIPVIRAGTQARAASTAPHGSTTAISWEALRLADAGPLPRNTETTNKPRLTTIATQSSCSARLAARQVHATRPRPNTAASRQTSPKAAPMLPSLVSGATTAPNRMRTSTQATIT